MHHPANHIFDHSLESLSAWCAARRWPAFRAKQVMEWVYAKGVTDPALMTNLSKGERETLSREMAFFSGDVLAHQIATDGTQKLLIQWEDGSRESGVGSRGESDGRDADHSDSSAAGGLHGSAPRTGGIRQGRMPPIHDAIEAGDAGGLTERAPRTGDLSLPLLEVAAGVVPDPKRQTECVMIPAENAGGTDRRTACVSSQVGCPVGCRFCASGLGGLDGSLSAGRIVEQVYRLDQLPGVDRITNVVFMGMGEPLANYGAVTRAIRTLCAPWGPHISARKITISTVGMPQAIERLADEFELPVTLALSLHAPNDRVRRQLIPWAQYTTIQELLSACAKWFKKTGREITLEYTLLGGVNDQPEHARELAQVARTLRSGVNLIRYNEVAGLPFDRPHTEDVREFQRLLREEGIKAHIRASRGRDIAAACGQLRHEAAGVR